MADGNFTFDESDFDDAIIEIANEIAQIKAISSTKTPQKSDPQITLKVEMELKKVKSPSTNFFRVMKTLEEVQVYSGNMPAAATGMPSMTERKYIPHSKGIDQKYHPLTITETVVVSENISDYHTPTLEDLFEDLEPEEKPTVVVTQKKKQLDTGSNMSVRNSPPQLPPGDKKYDKIAIKTVNIPNTITNNINRQLKENERNIFRSLMKSQKR